jgi:hypothetical protein
VLLTVPVAMIDGWREVLRERGRASGLAAALRRAMDWNWLDDDARPSEVAAQCDAVLATHDAPAPQPAPAPSAPVVDGAITDAAMRCARRAYGFWRGGSSGSWEATQYFDDGYAWRERDAAMYEVDIRAAISGPTAPAPAQPSGGELPPGCLDALRAYQQADEDGVFVKVSREALEAAIAALTQQPGLGELDAVHTLKSALADIAVLAQQPGAQPPTLPPVTDEGVRAACMANLHPLAEPSATECRHMRRALEAYRASLATPEPQS